MKNIFKLLLVMSVFFGANNAIQAEEPVFVNLTIRDGSIIVFSGVVPLAPAGTVSLNDVDGTPHDLDANSVLSIMHDADILSDNFSISNLTYFSSFGSLYLKCITDIVGESCDNWQYVVDGSYPSVGMDQNILSGGENVYLYFGPQNKITLNANSIKTSDTFTVKAEAYDYENNTWLGRTGITIGLTQPNLNDPFSPTEIMTSQVDDNGIANFSSIPEGTYDVGVKEDFYFPTERLTATSLPPPKSRKRGSRSNTPSTTGLVLGETDNKITFDKDKALAYLSSIQNGNGSFGEDIYTDWTTLAFAPEESYQTEAIKLVKYLSTNKTSGTLLTDFERRVMALMALGLNPYNTLGMNYISNIVSKFDGKQFGDAVEDNDDIFALIVLQNAGYGIDEKMIADDVSFVISRQKPNGSWNESIDMTGAGMQALSPFVNNEHADTKNTKTIEIEKSLEKAKEFLKKSQKEDGGWGNVSSTAWAMGGILALSEKPEDWQKDHNTPHDYLAINQDTDGGIKNENIKNKIWETAYALTALSGKTWNQIMQKFSKPENEITPSLTTTTKKQTLVKKASSSSASNENIAQVINTALTTAEPPSITIVQKKNWLGRIIDFLF